MTTDLLGQPVRQRGKHYVEPRGYAARPGGGPEGETCRTCRHRAGLLGRFAKCRLARAKWTNSRSSDILLRAPACEKWEGRDA